MPENPTEKAVPCETVAVPFRNNTMRRRKVTRPTLFVLMLCIGCGPSSSIENNATSSATAISDPSPAIIAWRSVDELRSESGATPQLAQFNSVFWEAADSDSLRQWIINSERISGSRVMEIGTGTGLISLLCVSRGAAAVVASDINPHALDNAHYNAQRLELSERIDLRLVPMDNPGPFVVLSPDEHFDLIISNPPWEDGPVTDLASHAFYDPGFQLLDALLDQAGERLTPGGSLLLAYGARPAIERILATATAKGWAVTILDDRSVEELPDLFLPGMLLELKQVPE